MTIEELQKIIMLQAKEKGFGTTLEEINVAEKVALIHGEVAEFYDGYRHNIKSGKDAYDVELGDIVVRVIQLAGCLGIDIEDAMKKKFEINKDRVWDWDKLNEKHS
jgi:NTP pyrophosphatase (non-canonical NTP hydrolase)